MNEKFLIKVTQEGKGVWISSHGTALQQLWALSTIIQSFTKDGYFSHFTKEQIKEVIDKMCEDPEGMQKELNKMVVEQMIMMNDSNIF